VFRLIVCAAMRFEQQLVRPARFGHRLRDRLCIALKS
jgi:hypothetical protein